MMEFCDVRMLMGEKAEGRAFPKMSPRESTIIVHQQMTGKGKMKNVTTLPTVYKFKILNRQLVPLQQSSRRRKLISSHDVTMTCAVFA